jgi:hypothetical protein
MLSGFNSVPYVEQPVEYAADVSVLVLPSRLQNSHESKAKSMKQVVEVHLQQAIDAY